MSLLATILSALALSGAPAEPPVLHIGPPPSPTVECRTTTFRDLVRGRAWTLRLCIRTRPAGLRWM